MTTCVSLARCALVALGAFGVLAIAPAAASAATVQAELRVLTPTRVLDPGTTYLVGAESVTTDPGADCNFGGAGGTGATFELAGAQRARVARRRSPRPTPACARSRSATSSDSASRSARSAESTISPERSGI